MQPAVLTHNLLCMHAVAAHTLITHISLNLSFMEAVSYLATELLLDYGANNCLVECLPL